MYKTINFGDFCDEFHGSQYENNFTYEGKRALFDYLEQYEEDVGAPIQLDIVAICCEYNEWEDVLDCARNYGYELGKNTEDETEEDARAFLEDHTQVIDIPDWTEYTPEAQIRHRGGIIIQNF